MTEVFDDDLMLSEHTVFDESIRVEGSIRGKNGESFNLTVHGHIDAGNIHARNIDAGNIDARNIYAGYIDARNIDAGDIRAGDIRAGDIDARNLHAWNIDAGDISFYAFCTVYESIVCISIKGRRGNHAEPVALDGEIKIKEQKQGDSR